MVINYKIKYSYKHDILTLFLIKNNRAKLFKTWLTEADLTILIFFTLLHADLPLGVLNKGLKQKIMIKFFSLGFVQ